MIADILNRQPDRDYLAQKMAEYERQHGKVKTTPILRRDSTGNFHNIEAHRMEESRRRGRAKSSAAAKAKARNPGPDPLEFGKRGTRQAKANAVLREPWP